MTVVGVVRRLAVVTSDVDTAAPPLGYGGIGRLAFGAFAEFSRRVPECVLFAPRARCDLAPSGRIVPRLPTRDELRGFDVIHATDPTAAERLPLRPPESPDTLFVCEQNAPWIAGPRGPNVRHVVFRADRLSAFGNGEARVCDQVLMAAEVGEFAPAGGYVLWLGRIHPDKAPDTLLAVANALPDHVFVVVGPAHMPEPAWPLNVRRIAEIGGVAKREILARADALLYTVSPDWVGAGELVLTEAAACGVPIVAQSTSPGCPASRLVVPGLTGFLGRDARALGDGVRRLGSLDRGAAATLLGPRLQPAQVAAVRLVWMEQELAALRAVRSGGQWSATQHDKTPDPALSTAIRNSSQPLELARAQLAARDWHGAIANAQAALAAQCDEGGEHARLQHLIVLGGALLGAGLDQRAKGDTIAATKTFGWGAQTLAVGLNSLASPLARLLHPVWLQLDAALRSELAAQFLRAFWVSLVEHDERIKAERLLECVPWMLEDHPVALEIEAWRSSRMRHVASDLEYRDYYAREHQANPVLPHRHPEFVLSRAQDAIRMLSSLPAGARVLEVGCFDGPVTMPLLRALPMIELTCVDPNETALARLGGLMAEFGLAATLRGELPPVGSGFDAAVWAEVIEHVRDPVHDISVIADRVVEGAPIFISTPWGAFELGRPPGGGFEAGAEQHVRALTPRSLVAVIDAASLSVVRLWRSPSGYARGDGLHAIVVKKRPPARGLAFATEGSVLGVPALLVELARSFVVELFAPVAEPFVEAGVRVWPAVQRRHASGRILPLESALDPTTSRSPAEWMAVASRRDG